MYFLCLCKGLATLPKKASIVINVKVDLQISGNFGLTYRQEKYIYPAMYEVSTRAGRMLPLLIANPRLISSYGQARQTQHDGHYKPSNCCHHDEPRAALSFHPFPHSSRGRICELFVYIRQPCSKILVRDDLIWIADCCCVETQDIRVKVACGGRGQ
jgi:hypothetical protein